MSHTPKKVAFADENAPPRQPAPSTGNSAFNPSSAAQEFLAGIANELDLAAQFPDADEGEETEVDEYAQAKAVKQAQGELDEPEGFDEMVENIESARRKKAADYF